MRIAIEGNIGAGKSTVLEHLRARCQDVPIFPEPVTAWGDLLDKFYKDPSQWGLAFSLRVLVSFCEPHEHESCVVERCPLSCRHVFTQLLFNDGHLSQDEWDLFKEYCDVLGWQPDAIVYINTPAHVCHDRIRARGRPCEAGIDVTHLRRLEFQYGTMLKYANVPVVVVDGMLGPEELRDATDAALEELLRGQGAS